MAKTAKKELKVEPNEDQELMTLEDFLAKADAKVEEREFVKVERLWSDAGVYGGIVSERSGVEEGGRRGKRRVESLDKVVMQRQRRMIKNRESAARSRERKQVRVIILCILRLYMYANVFVRLYVLKTSEVLLIFWQRNLVSVFIEFREYMNTI